jgi:hypothetical protein
MRAPDRARVAPLTDTEWSKIRKILASSGVDADTVKTGTKKYSAYTLVLPWKICVDRGENPDTEKVSSGEGEIVSNSVFSQYIKNPPRQKQLAEEPSLAAGRPGIPLRRALDNYRRNISSWNWAAARKRRSNDMRKIIKAIDALDFRAAEECAPVETPAAQQALVSLRARLEQNLALDMPRRGQASEKEMRSVLWGVLVETWNGFAHHRPTRPNLVAFILAVTPAHFLNARNPEADLKAVANFLDKPFHTHELVKALLDSPT